MALVPMTLCATRYHHLSAMCTTRWTPSSTKRQPSLIRLLAASLGEDFLKEEMKMSSAEDSILEVEIRDMWWEQGEAVMREMCEDDEA